MVEAYMHEQIEQQVEATVTATQLVAEFPIGEAFQNIGAYAYDAESPIQALLSIYARYGWPVTEVASVLLAVDAMDEPFQTEAVAVPKQDDTLLPPLSYTLPNGTRVAMPEEHDIILVPVETRLPDNWNFSYPHTPEELTRRAEIAEDIGIYLATGAGKLMEKESPMRILEASPKIEKFDRYAKACEATNALFSSAYRSVLGMQEHQQELGALYWMDVGLAAVDKIVDELAIDGLVQQLQSLQHITPEPPYLKHIPRHERISDTDLAQAQYAVDQRARYARTDLTLFMHTSPSAPVEPLEAIVIYE